MRRAAVRVVPVAAALAVAWMAASCTTTRRTTPTSTPVPAATDTPVGGASATNTPPGGGMSPTATPGGAFSVTLQDPVGTPVSGAVVMINANTSGAQTTNASGLATFLGVTYPLNVHIFSPHAASTPNYSPRVASVFGVNSGALTYGFMRPNVTGGSLAGTITGAQSATNMVVVRYRGEYPVLGSSGSVGGTGGSGYSFGAGGVQPGVVRVEAIEMNASPTPSPVTAAFYSNVAVSPGSNTTLNIALTPVSAFPAGTVTVNATFNSSYALYFGELYAGSSATAAWKLGEGRTLCFSNCNFPVPYFGPAGSTTYWSVAAAFDLSQINGCIHLSRGATAPTVHNATFLSPGTVTGTPSSSNASFVISNTTGSALSAVHVGVEGATGSSLWEAFGPAVAALGTTTLVFPTTLPGGVPAGYLLQSGTSYDYDANPAVASGAYAYSSLTPPTLFPYLDQIGIQRGSFTY